jgi:CBS domain-containing protein
VAQKVSELMTSAPVTLSSGQTVADAARAMREAGIGDVLVIGDMAIERDERSALADISAEPPST